MSFESKLFGGPERPKPAASPQTTEQISVAKKEAPLTEREQLKNRLQEILKKINLLEQRLDKARLEGKTKLADLFSAEIAKTKAEQESIFHKLQALQERLKTEPRKPTLEVPALNQRANIGGAEFPNIPYEHYKEVSKQLTQEAAEAEKQEKEARRRYDLKTAEIYKQKKAQLMEKQRQILREAAVAKSLQRGKLEK